MHPKIVIQKQLEAQKAIEDRLMVLEETVTSVERKMDILIKALKEWSNGRNKG